MFAVATLQRGGGHVTTHVTSSFQSGSPAPCGNHGVITGGLASTCSTCPRCVHRPWESGGPGRCLGQVVGLTPAPPPIRPPVPTCVIEEINMNRQNESSGLREMLTAAGDASGAPVGPPPSRAAVCPSHTRGTKLVQHAVLKATRRRLPGRHTHTIVF